MRGWRFTSTNTRKNEPNLQPNCCEDDRPQEIELDKNALRQIIREEKD